jgi:GNAT superfamily N-acetyltransferase
MKVSPSIVLPFAQWPLVAPVVGEFGNGMPDHPGRATFITALAHERLAGFVHVETVYHFNCVYVAPEFENTGLTMRLIKDAVSCIPEGFSGIWLTDRNVDRLAAQIGARNIGTYRAYRKDR